MRDRYQCRGIVEQLSAGSRARSLNFAPHDFRVKGLALPKSHARLPHGTLNDPEARRCDGPSMNNFLRSETSSPRVMRTRFD